MSTRHERDDAARRELGQEPDLGSMVDRLLDRELGDAEQSELFEMLRGLPEQAESLAESQRMLATLRSTELGPDLTERILSETHQRRAFIPKSVRRQVTAARLALAAMLLIGVAGFAVASNHSFVPLFHTRSAPVSSLIERSEAELANSVRTIGQAIGSVRAFTSPDSADAADTADDHSAALARIELTVPEIAPSPESWSTRDVPSTLPDDLASFRTAATQHSSEAQPSDPLPSYRVVAVHPIPPQSEVSEPAPSHTRVIVGLESRRPTLLNPSGIVCTSRVTATPLEISDRSPWEAIPRDQDWLVLFQGAGKTVVPLPIELLPPTHHDGP